jgi:hypothetical protein
MADDIHAAMRPRLGLWHAVIAMDVVLLAVLARDGRWLYSAVYLGVMASQLPQVLLPRATIRGDLFSYRALGGGFSFRAPDVIGLKRDYIFRAPDSQPFALDVQLRGESRSRTVELGRFSRRDVALILSFFSRVPAEA